MSITFTGIRAMEILDSRGRPTLAVTADHSDGPMSRPGCPPVRPPARARRSSCATATRPGTRGKGVLTAVGNVNGEIAEALAGREFADLAELDQALIDARRHDNKSRLGANAIVGVSMAAARAFAPNGRRRRCGGT